MDNTVNLVDVGDLSGKSSASARKTALINFKLPSALMVGLTMSYVCKYLKN